MAGMSLSTGLISGMDTGALVNQLMQIEAQLADAAQAAARQRTQPGHGLPRHQYPVRRPALRRRGRHQGHRLDVGQGQQLRLLGERRPRAPARPPGRSPSRSTNVATAHSVVSAAKWTVTGTQTAADLAYGADSIDVTVGGDDEERGHRRHRQPGRRGQGDQRRHLPPALRHRGQGLRDRVPAAGHRQGHRRGRYVHDRCSGRVHAGHPGRGRQAHRRQRRPRLRGHLGHQHLQRRSSTARRSPSPSRPATSPSSSPTTRLPSPRRSARWSARPTACSTRSRPTPRHGHVDGDPEGRRHAPPAVQPGARHRLPPDRRRCGSGGRSRTRAHPGRARSSSTRQTFTTALAADPAIVRTIFTGTTTTAGVDGVAGNADDVTTANGIAVKLEALAKRASDSTTGMITALAKSKDSSRQGSGEPDRRLGPPPGAAPHDADPAVHRHGDRPGLAPEPVAVARRPAGLAAQLVLLEQVLTSPLTQEND